MVDMDTLKVLLTTTAASDWEICKVDASEAFSTTTVNNSYPSHLTKISQIVSTCFVRRLPELTDYDIHK